MRLQEWLQTITPVKLGDQGEYMKTFYKDKEVNLPMGNHTPTPWKIIGVAQDRHLCVTGNPEENCWLVYRNDTEFIQRLGFFETLAQAELAQRAVNSLTEGK